MAVADFGDNVNGKKIEIISADHQKKPDVGGAIARQWYDNDGVDAIVDVPTSSVALAVQDVARERKKVFLISGAASSDLTGKACSPTAVHWTYDTVALANGTGSAVVKAGGDTWFFITADYAFGHALEREPTMAQAGVYGAVLHYLNAIKATGSDDGPTVVKKMKDTPINDFMTKNGKILENGRLIRDMYLYEVKKPSESKGEWDVYKLISTIPGEQAFKRPGGNECPLVKG